MQNFEMIALYLNLASLRIAKDGNKLKFLTGAETPTITCGYSESHETQIMWCREMMWIANNDDAVSATQRSLLNLVGAGTVDELVAHVERYATRVFKMAQGGIVRGNMTEKEKVLLKLISLETGVEEKDIAEQAVMNLTGVAPASNGTYSINSPNAPPATGITFVTGNYIGKVCPDGPVHAEQKLLVALSKAPTTVHGGVHLTGCKSPCTSCAKVLKETLSLTENRLFSLKYRNPEMDALRKDAGLGVFSATGIRELDVAKVF